MPLKVDLLIVDDNPADFFLIKDLLDDLDTLEFTILEASSVGETLSILKNNSIDIVLLDMFLPDSSGIDTFYSVHNEFPNAIIIVLSGLSDKKVALKTVQAGAQDFLLKGDFNERLLEKTITYSIERKKNLKLLEDSEKKYKALFEVTPHPLFIICINTMQFINANNEALTFFGYSEKEFQLMDLNQLLLKPFKVNKLSTNENQQFRNIALKKDCSELFVDVTLKNVVLLEKTFLLVQLKDVSEQVYFERNRLEMINSIQDNERSNFAMELHDGLAQELVLLNIYIDQIKAKCQEIPEIDQAKNIISAAIRQTRRLTYNVSPPLLNEGFFKGISVLFERFRDANDINFNFDLEQYKEELTDCENELNDDVSYNAFRIIQEFLNNSIKHSNANEITCSIYAENNNCVIDIKDNGIGFNKLTSDTSGMGINNMKKRAQLFQIGIKIDSQENQGTSLQLNLPKSKNANF